MQFTGNIVDLSVATLLASAKHLGRDGQGCPGVLSGRSCPHVWRGRCVAWSGRWPPVVSLILHRVVSPPLLHSPMRGWMLGGWTRSPMASSSSALGCPPPTRIVYYPWTAPVPAMWPSRLALVVLLSRSQFRRWLPTLLALLAGPQLNVSPFGRRSDSFACASRMSWRHPGLARSVPLAAQA